MKEQELIKMVRGELKRHKRLLWLPYEMDDMQQECLLHLWQQDSWNKEPVYIKQAVAWWCVDLKRRRREMFVSLEEADVEDSYNPQEDWARSEWLDSQLSSLSWEEKKALRLRLRGMTLKEVSAECGLPVKTAHRLLDSVVQKLAQLHENV